MNRLTIKLTKITMLVILITAFWLGQWTFFNSALTSFKNCKGEMPKLGLVNVGNSTISFDFSKNLAC